MSVFLEGRDLCRDCHLLASKNAEAQARCARLCRLVDQLVIGPLIYWLNVNRFVVRRMGAGHVYADSGYLIGGRLEEKLAVIRAAGARFASVRFVTGRLDPLSSREQFLDCARRATAPIMVAYGNATPSRSRAEIKALTTVPGIRSVRLPSGKLSVHEEFPDATVKAITPFLRTVRPTECSFIVDIGCEHDRCSGCLPEALPKRQLQRWTRPPKSRQSNCTSVLVLVQGRMVAKSRGRTGKFAQGCAAAAGRSWRCCAAVVKLFCGSERCVFLY
jgi:hypothetical protein